MTQPPQFNYYQPAEAPDPLAAARRASVPMFILGLVLAGFGLCSIISVWQMAPEQLLKQQSELMGSAAQTGLAPETFKTVGIAMHGVIVLVGLVLLALAVPVRGGSYAATIGALVVSGIVMAILLLFALVMLVFAIAAPAVGATMLCVLMLPIVGFTVQFFWLIQAARAAYSTRSLTQRYAAQYWQYYQQQQQSPYPSGPYAPPGPPPQYPPVQYPPPSASQPDAAPSAATPPPDNPYGNPPAQ